MAGELWIFAGLNFRGQNTILEKRENLSPSKFRTLTVVNRKESSIPTLCDPSTGAVISDSYAKTNLLNQQFFNYLATHF